MVQPSSSTEVMAPEEAAAAVAPPGKLRPMLTEQSIKAITYDLRMAEKLVTEALEEGIDYGSLPGLPGKGLRDPGAAKIMNAFETYPRHKVLYHDESEHLITWAIETEIIHRGTGVIVGAGVGACSTREPKYKYRWFSKKEAEELGFTEIEIDGAKKRKGKRRNTEGNWYDLDEYRLENPEYGEQVNTIMQMAAKRSETDASKTLPGVASALRRLFDSDMKETSKGKKKGKVEDINEDSPRWTTFWNAQKDILGPKYAELTHQICGVKSMQEWLSSGKSLDEATRLSIEWKKKHQRDPDNIKEKDIPDDAALEQVMEECYGWESQRVWSEANYASRKNFEEARVETAWAVFCRLRDTIRQWQKQSAE